MITNNRDLIPYYMFSLAIVFSGIYLHFYFLNSVINFNEYWLYTCSARILDGEKMSIGCYDSNPPLSVLLYIPVVALHRWMLIPVNIGLLVYSLSALCFSVWATYFMIVKADITNSSLRTLFLFSYFITNIMISGLFFGERDQFVLFGLIPFIFAQVAITKNKNKNSFIEFSILFVCALLMFIKPHYGLIPFVLIIHRLKKNNYTFSEVLKWQDIQAVAMATACYALLIAIYFQDFFSEIIVTSLKFYVLSHREFSLYDVFFILLTINLLLIGIYFFHIKKSKPEPFIILLCGVSFLALFPFLLQFKGTPYQAIPPKILLICSGILILFERISDQTSHKKYVLLCGFFVIGFCYLFMPINAKTPNHQVYKDHLLTHIIKQNSSDEGSCDFFIFESMKAAQILAYYSECNLSSRFPVLWFFPTLLAAAEETKKNKSSILSIADIDFYKKKFAAYVTEDLIKYRPMTIILAENFSFVDNGDTFFLDQFLLENNPDFKAFWAQYHLQKKVTATFPDIMAGTSLESPKTSQNYAIYVRE